MVTERGGRAGDVLRNRPLLTLMLGHYTVDMYVGVLPVLYPVLTGRFNLDLKTIGLLALAYSGMASLAQPIFGWIADKYGTRYIGFALSWTAINFALLGFAPNFAVMLLLAALAGIGSGAYHPLGSLNAAAVIPERSRNMAMSAYVSGGTFGVASGPLIGAILFNVFGVRGTALMVLPGVTIAIWMLFEMRRIALRRAPAKGTAGASRNLPPVPVLPMLAVMGVMMSRAWTMSSIQAYVPTWYKMLGYGPGFYGPLATVVVLASAFGAIGTGTLADRFGRRAVMFGSLILTIPAILLFVQYTGPIAFVTGALVGFLAASTGPLMLVMAQQLMTGRAGLASGIILGLGFVTGAIGVPVTGAFADAFGLEAALRAQVLVVLLTLAITWLLPSEAQMRDHHRRAQAVLAPPKPAGRLAEETAD